MLLCANELIRKEMQLICYCSANSVAIKKAMKIKNCFNHYLRYLLAALCLKYQIQICFPAIRLRIYFVEVFHRMIVFLTDS